MPLCAKVDMNVRLVEWDVALSNPVSSYNLSMSWHNPLAEKRFLVLLVIRGTVASRCNLPRLLT
jgi:hypothetical protein